MNLSALIYENVSYFPLLYYSFLGGRIDPMIPGKKVMAIFGFCSIKNFSDATEILQEKVMIFTNEIAELVHICCDSFHGAINKNLGDCFLLVWKFTEDES